MPQAHEDHHDGEVGHAVGGIAGAAHPQADGSGVVQVNVVISDGAGGEIPDAEGVIGIQQGRVDAPLAQDGHAVQPAAREAFSSVGTASVTDSSTPWSAACFSRSARSSGRAS